MEKYQITEFYADSTNAGSKAPQDIIKIIDKMNFNNIKIPIIDDENKFDRKVINQIRGIFSWSKIYEKILPNSIVFLQYPQYKRQYNRLRILKKLKKEKKVHFITLIHDVDELRNVKLRDDIYNEFYYILKISDKIIVHNLQMKKYFLSKGFKSRNLICLDIFDYLRSDYQITYPKFSTEVIIAGNLDASKSKYLTDLHKVNNKFILYGSNYYLPKYKNINYKGSLSPEDIPSVLNTGYGLVWDGISIESCRGSFGEYLKYNNPHKLSLYISSNLPVIIWSKAAEAEFVKKNNIGITVDSLNDLPHLLSAITEKEYKEMVKNTIKLAKRLVSGYYTEHAVNQALKDIEKNIYNER